MCIWQGSGSGIGCGATESEMRAYLSYTEGAECPSDWALVQRLLFHKGCLSLPRRRCRAVMPPRPQEVGATVLTPVPKP